MSYFLISKEDIVKRDYENNYNIPNLLAPLSELSYNNNSPELAAGASEATTKTFFFVAPVAMKITNADVITTQVNTGTGNVPVISLRNLTEDAEIGTTSIALAGAALGDVNALTLDADEVELAKGDVLEFRIVNPNGTITTAFKGILQIEWHAIAS